MLTTTYPQVHWIALTLLGLSVVFGFLLAAAAEGDSAACGGA